MLKSLISNNTALSATINPWALELSVNIISLGSLNIFSFKMCSGLLKLKDMAIINYAFDVVMCS